MKDLLETIKFFFPKDELDGKDKEIVNIREILERLYYEDNEGWGIIQTKYKKEIFQIAKDVNKLRIFIEESNSITRANFDGNNYYLSLGKFYKTISSSKLKPIIEKNLENEQITYSEFTEIKQSLVKLKNENKHYSISVFVYSLIEDEYRIQERRWIFAFLVPMFLSLFTGLTVGIITTFLAAYLRAKLGAN